MAMTDRECSNVQVTIVGVMDHDTDSASPGEGMEVDKEGRSRRRSAAGDSRCIAFRRAPVTEARALDGCHDRADHQVDGYGRDSAELFGAAKDAEALGSSHCCLSGHSEVETLQLRRPGIQCAFSIGCSGAADAGVIVALRARQIRAVPAPSSRE